MKAAQGFDDIFSVEPNTGVIHSDHSFRGNQDFSFYVSTIILYHLSANWHFNDEITVRKKEIS